MEIIALNHDRPLFRWISLKRMLFTFFYSLIFFATHWNIVPAAFLLMLYPLLPLATLLGHVSLFITASAVATLLGTWLAVWAQAYLFVSVLEFILTRERGRPKG
jgi:hypothetical protein